MATHTTNNTLHWIILTCTKIVFFFLCRRTCPHRARKRVRTNSQFFHQELKFSAKYFTFTYFESLITDDRANVCSLSQQKSHNTKWPAKNRGCNFLTHSNSF